MMKYVPLVLLVVIVVAGCTQPPPPPAPKAAPPPPPTPEQIAGEIRQGLAPLTNLMVDNGKAGWGAGGKGAAGRVTDEMETQVVNAIKASKAKHSATENGRTALATVSHEIEEMISKARDQERWRLVLCAIDCYDAINPGATKMARLKERATQHLSRPIVHLVGFFRDKGADDTYAFMKVQLPPNTELHEVHARKGDEFYNVKLLDITGNNTGIELEYLAIPGNIWRVTKEQH